MKNKNKQGGKRKGAGAKPKYGEATTPVVTRVPVSKIDQFKDHSKKLLRKWVMTMT